MRTEEKEKEEEEEEWPTSRSAHEVLLIVLPYLHSLFELLSMTGVSRSLRDAIRDETALWTKIVVEQPLSSRLTDDILWEITTKSAGKLNTLILRHCLRITDMGLRRVVDANPLIRKIIVPGCTELTPEGIIGCVESLTKMETLHINGVHRFTKDHLSALSTHLPHEGAVDVEVCPKCDQVMMIPSCSRASCNRGRRHERKCRGCWFCVPRCTECSVCLGSDTEIQEAACGGDSLCLECWLVLPKCRFCNKPYCSSHSSLRHDIVTADHSVQPMFECQACHYRAGTTNPYDAFDYQI
ncbi:F-box protein SKIP28 [Raphanus sativus]|uniref:F-box protein SKIP28 n=1 Tax=Raphanus sativus TaxID=3726 RepID=A0A6J0JVV3_RAPSA|nr:F-box protein SKIP28 [Raphanus sativus]KAJ4888479.1 F-box protein SKIP28 [Raphanus sativus]